jgi:hypothetical protein
MRRGSLQRAGCLAALPVLLASAAYADTPRVDFALGAWQHEADGTLTSNDPLLAVPAGMPLSDDRESYERFGVRLGNKWWAPVIRARHTNLTTGGRMFVDDSTILSSDTTDTVTSLDFEQLDSIIYLTYGDELRAELDGVIKQIDGRIETVRTRLTTLGGVNRAVLYSLE